MDMNERAPAPPASRLWIGLPAVMVLATCVTAQAAEAAHADELSSAPDLSWVVRGGAAHSACAARKALAKQAAMVIQVLDRISCAAPALPVPIMVTEVQPSAPRDLRLAAWLDPVHSNHQTSAP